MQFDQLMMIWKMVDAGVLSEDQADRLEDLAPVEAEAVLRMIPSSGSVTDEHLEDAIDAAQSLLEYFVKWRPDIAGSDDS